MTDLSDILHAHRSPPAAPSTSAAISLRRVSKRFARRNETPLQVLDSIDLDIPHGQVVAILGASGCGKSTLLNLIAGLAHPDDGAILVEGASTAAFSDWRAVGYLFQDDRLLPWRTARDNVCFGLEAGGVPRGERQARAIDALAAVGLAGFESAYPHELSGGMRSRVALARSLVNEPRMLLLDEPFSKLDPGTRAQMHAELLNIQASRNMTVVFVTHDVEEAIVLADQVVILQPRPGRVREVVAVTLPRPRAPSDPEVAELIRQLRVRV